MIFLDSDLNYFKCICLLTIKFSSIFSSLPSPPPHPPSSEGVREGLFIKILFKFLVIFLSNSENETSANMDLDK